MHDGAPYSAIGIVELKLLFDEINCLFSDTLDPNPILLRDYSKLRYGNGSHSSRARKILGSIVLTAFSDRKIPINITHIVLEGSSQWVIGKQVTRKCKIDHMSRHALLFFNGRCMDSISIVDHEFLSYISLSRFFTRGNNQTLSCLNANVLYQRPWHEIKKILDKVHRHVCGHASFTDFKLLFERNGL